MNAAPGRVAGWLVALKPWWIDLLEPGKEVVFPKYLGHFTIAADVTYPIEKTMLAGSYDRTTLAVVHRFVHRGDVALDVGANVGAITLALASAVGDSGRVLAFEPGPPTFARLARNLSLNPRVSRVVSIHQLGLADRRGALNWSEDMDNRGNAGLLDSGGIAVPVETLDGFCAREKLSRVDFIKVDVEGMEYEVFKGALVTLRTSRPVLYFETLAPFAAVRGFDIFGAIEAMLRGIGYTLFKVNDDGTIVPTTSADLSVNTLALMDAPVPSGQRRDSGASAARGPS